MRSASKRIVSAVALVAAVAACAPSRDTTERDAAPGLHRVVIEVNVDGPEAWDGILNNVENARIALGADNTHIEVVAHGKGLGLLLASNIASSERIAALAQAGVVFAACENTMRRKNVSKDALLPRTITVDSGVAEVIRKQEAAWSYLKGGG